MNSSGLDGKSVLVTGGCGFVGSWLVEELAKLNLRNLVVVDNLFAGRRENLHGVESSVLKVYIADASDYKVMSDIVGDEDIDFVFALATVRLPLSLEQPLWASRAIYNLASCVCQLAKEKKIERLIHLSSSEVYGTAQYLPMDEDHPMGVETPYAAAKAGADLLVRSYQRTFGIDALTIRPFNIYGPRQAIGEFCALVPSVLKCAMVRQPPVVFGDGEQTRDWSYVSDVVRAILLVTECESLQGKVVNVGSGKATSVNEMIGTLFVIMGSEGSVQYAPSRLGDVRMHQADIRLLQQRTGFAPAVPLEEGLRMTWDWYQFQE